MPIFPATAAMRWSNLFHIELIFICPTAILCILFLLKIFKSFIKITFKIGFIIFRNLFKRNIFTVFRNVTDNFFFSPYIFFSVFSYLSVAINILIGYFFHIVSVFHCTITNIFKLIVNKVCDNANFKLPITVVCISITFVMINNLLFISSFLIWRIEL